MCPNVLSVLSVLSFVLLFRTSGCCFNVVGKFKLAEQVVSPRHFRVLKRDLNINSSVRMEFSVYNIYLYWRMIAH